MLTSRFVLMQLTLLAFFIIFSLFLPETSPAKLSGECYKCHTMHDSQDGSKIARDGTGIGWDGNNITGGSNQGPMNFLLITNCVGCHTSKTNDETIHDPGGLNIPIVFNTGGYPTTNALAGGNFFWTSQGSTYDAYGHNVYGIAAKDTMLTVAPGRQGGTCGSNSCHYSLANAPLSQYDNKAGCQGCHVYTSHHKNRGWYRFLKGHSDPPFDPGTENNGDYVIGKGDTDWEKTKGSEDHNWYKGTSVPYKSPGSSTHALETYKTITSFCSGCHGIFHNEDTISGTVYASPWKRHPTDILLPTTGEYSAYKPADVGGYSVEAPVAWLDPLNPQAGQAVVMCLSCHRPHGSPYRDMLRWDYTTMIAGGTSNDTGCFTCHTTKNVAP